MALIKTLKDNEGQIIYPQSTTQAIFMEDGTTLKESIGGSSGICPLNPSKKVAATYLPNYTDVGYVPSDDAASIRLKQVWSHEQTYNYDDYNRILTDTIQGIACGFKAQRGLFNQLFVNDIVFCRPGTEANNQLAEAISFYVWDGVKSKSAVRDADNNITTAGYNILQNYTKIGGISNDGGLILKSSTAGSTKYFKITVDDNGQLTTSPYTYTDTIDFETEV